MFEHVASVVPNMIYPVGGKSSWVSMAVNPILVDAWNSPLIELDWCLFPTGYRLVVHLTWINIGTHIKLCIYIYKWREKASA